MFELSVACKYLLPRWRQLSVSIISIISIAVIALIVWLVVVFFSVTHGLEKSWIQKLIALTAPIRATPTEDYYKTYYYLIDSISESSQYNLKTIYEKLAARKSDPYDPEYDVEIPPQWQPADRNEDGSLKDLVKEVYRSIHEIPGLRASDFEITASNLTLNTVRGQSFKGNSPATAAKKSLSQTTYLGTFDPENPLLKNAALPLSGNDLSNILSLIPYHNEAVDQDEVQARLPSELIRDKLKEFFSLVTVSSLKTPSQGWILPRELYPESGAFNAWIFTKEGQIVRVLLPSKKEDRLPDNLPATIAIKEGKLLFKNGIPSAILDGNEMPVRKFVPLLVINNFSIPAKLIDESIEKARDPKDLKFHVTLDLQETKLPGVVQYGNLLIDGFKVKKSFEGKPESLPYWLYTQAGMIKLPKDSLNGNGILLPKSFRDSGVLAGDRGFIAYYTPTASVVQEQKMPIWVAGFYDPGIIPIGGKYVVADRDIVNLVRSSHNMETSQTTNGINIRFNDLNKAEEHKQALQKSLKEKGIDSYWKIETYKEYEFTKDIIQQLHSEKNLFSLIATVVIIVACSNIISMLIILVNDKKLEIGILRSMGASSWSIGLIFGFCGVVMGMIGSLAGILMAVFTLQHLDALIGLISLLQGHEMFNPVYYGEKLPADLSPDALLFVMIMTGAISMLAGVVPAVKASLLKPSSILRSE